MKQRFYSWWRAHIIKQYMSCLLFLQLYLLPIVQESASFPSSPGSLSPSDQQPYSQPCPYTACWLTPALELLLHEVRLFFNSWHGAISISQQHHHPQGTRHYISLDSWPFWPQYIVHGGYQVDRGMNICSLATTGRSEPWCTLGFRLSSNIS